MFKNHQHNVFIKNNISELVLNALATNEKTKDHKSLIQAAEALVSFKKPATGKSLFEKKNKVVLLQGMKKNMDALRNDKDQDDTSSGDDDKEKRQKDNAGAKYQKVLSEMWEKADQEGFNERAKVIDVNE